jgi:hypothetical protein
MRAVDRPILGGRNHEGVRQGRSNCVSHYADGPRRTTNDVSTAASGEHDRPRTPHTDRPRRTKPPSPTRSAHVDGRGVTRPIAGNPVQRPKQPSRRSARLCGISITGIGSLRLCRRRTRPLPARCAQRAEERLDMGSLHFRTQTRSYAPPASHRVARRVDVQCRRPDRPVRDIVLQRSY